MNAFQGKIELQNGIVIDWIRFDESESGAMSQAMSQHPFAVSCWIVESK